MTHVTAKAHTGRRHCPASSSTGHSRSSPPSPRTWTTFLANKARLSPRGGSQPSREGFRPCTSPADTGQLTSANIDSDNKRHAGQGGPKRIQRTQPLQKRPPRGTAQAAGWGGPSGRAAASSPMVRTVHGTQSPGAGKQGTAQRWDSSRAERHHKAIVLHSLHSGQAAHRTPS